MKPITKDEYLMGRAKWEDLSADKKLSIEHLLEKVNALLEKFGSYRKVNSGLRTMESHLATYKAINEKKKSQGLPEVKVPMGSKHLSGEAIDLEDRDGKLKVFIKGLSEQELQELGLYYEEFSHSPSWVHSQIVAPKSKSRFFNP